MRRLERLLKMIGICFSPAYGMKVANNYWQNTTVTHGNMKEETFNFYFTELLKIVESKKDKTILDYGGGNGEIAYRFKENGYKITHCDLSKIMVNNAQNKFNLESCECDQINGKYDSIIFHNAFFYVHPKKQQEVLYRLFTFLKDGGKLYITDTPDFNKRLNSFGGGRMHLFLTRFFSVYQIELAGFYIKDKALKNIAKQVGFQKVSKLDSWCNYRSHWILER